MLAVISDTGILVLVVAIVLLFGTSQIPKIARNVAHAGKEFRQAQEEVSPTKPLATSTVDPDEQIVLTRTQLDAMIASRQAAGSDRD